MAPIANRISKKAIEVAEENKTVQLVVPKMEPLSSGTKFEADVLLKRDKLFTSPK